MISKFEQRQKFKAALEARQVQDPARRPLQRNQDAILFSEQLEKFMAGQSGPWGAFHPLPSEPPILSALEKITHVHWFFPRLRGNVLEFSSAKPSETHSWGFLEPIGGQVKAAEELEGFLIPGLGFDRWGQRLGRGGGYYDRSLEKTRGLRVGLCYDVQLVDELVAIEDHDLTMDFILTEKETVGLANPLKGR